MAPGEVTAQKQIAARDEEVRTSLKTLKTVNKVGEEVLQLLQPMVRKAVPLQFMEVCGGAHIQAGGCLKDAVTPWRAHTGVGSWEDLWCHDERSPHCSRFADRTYDPEGDPCWSS